MCDVEMLNTLSDRYITIEHIGGGTYGEVTKCKDLKEQKIVALKEIKILDPQEGFPQTTVREILLLKELHHENIVRLENIVKAKDTGKVYLVFEYCEYDLCAVIKTGMHIKDENVCLIKSIINQILIALNFCNIHHIIHRDLKPANIFLTHDNIVKLGDFGLARKIVDEQQKLTKNVITLWYKPPELLFRHGNYGPEVDIWSAGCILFELVAGMPLFLPKGSDSEINQLNAIFFICGTPVDCPEFERIMKELSIPPQKSQLEEYLNQKVRPQWTGLIPLMMKMLRLNPKKRITAEEALNDPFLRSKGIHELDPRYLPTLDWPEIHQQTVNKPKEIVE